MSYASLERPFPNSLIFLILLEVKSKVNEVSYVSLEREFPNFYMFSTVFKLKSKVNEES